MALIPTRTTILVLAVFVLANIAIFVTSDPGCRVVGELCYAEANHWGGPIAEILLTHGKMVTMEDPSVAFTAWPPGFGAFEALTRIIGPESNVSLLIVLQLMMVVLAGLWVQKIVEQSFPGYGVIGLALVVLNPNLLIHANLAKGEVALMLLVLLAFVCLIEYAKSPRLLLVIGCGAALGLSALVRPVTQFLIYSLPLVFLLTALVSGRGYAWLAALAQGALATVVAIAVVSPWVMYVNNAGHGYRMVDKAEEHLFFLDNLRFLSLETPGRRDQSPKTEYLAGEGPALATKISNWDSLTESEKYEHRLEHIKEHYLSGAIPPAVFARSFVWSWVRTLAGPGAGWAQVLYTGIANEGNPTTVPFFATLSGTFVVIARILGLIGLWAMIRNRQFGLLVACVGLVAYVTLLPLFHGQSRYRVTIEPQLAVMASFGVVYLHMIWRRLKAQRNPDTTQDL